MDLYVLFLCFSGVFVGELGVESSFDVSVMNITVHEGDVAVLPCSVHYNIMRGYHKVEWKDQWSTLLTADDQRFVDDPRISIERPRVEDWNLQIKNTSYRDRGQYTCQVHTNPVKNKTVMLIVLIPPTIINESSSRDQTVREGETVTLICNVTGVPRPDVTWYRLANGGTTPKERIGATGEMLKIHNVSRYCAGTYECVAYNNVGPVVTRQIKVFVYLAPEVSIPTKRIYQYIGKEVMLDCKMTAYPLGIMYWKKGDRDIDDSMKDKYLVVPYREGKTRTTLSLIIRDIQQDDFGQYTCYAENSIGNDTESVYLFDYSILKKYKSTTKIPTLQEPTQKIWPNIPLPEGNVTGNPTRIWTKRPVWSSESGNNSGPDISNGESELEKQTGSRHSKCSGQGCTTLRSTGKAAAHDHVTLTSMLYVLSLITSTLVLYWHL